MHVLLSLAERVEKRRSLHCTVNETIIKIKQRHKGTNHQTPPPPQAIKVQIIGHPVLLRSSYRESCSYCKLEKLYTLDLRIHSYNIVTQTLYLPFPVGHTFSRVLPPF